MECDGIVDGEILEQVDDGEWSLLFPFPDFVPIAGGYMRNIFIRDVTPGLVSAGEPPSRIAIAGSDGDAR